MSNRHSRQHPRSERHPRRAGVEHAGAARSQRGLPVDPSSRQSRQLSALFDIATELSSSLDTETVLRRIVHRARILVGADAAYLALNDDDAGDAYIRRVDGIHTQQFAELRLPHGTGLGGLVAQRGRAEWTNDYLGDDRFDHTAPTDDAVATEKLKAVLGVPLLRDDAVVGVLMAANRDARNFDAADADLLSSLSVHATIALVNARLYAEAEGAAASRAEALSELKVRSAMIQRAASLHERLTALIVKGANESDVAQAVVENVGGRICILGSDGTTLGGAGTDSIDRLEVESAAVTQLSAVKNAMYAAVIRPGLVMVPIGTPDDYLGVLAYSGPHSDAGALRMLERTAMVLAILILNDRVRSETEFRMGSESIGDLLAREPHDPRALLRRARALNIDVRQLMRVIVVSLPVERTRQVLSIVAALARERRGLAGEHGGHVVAVVPDAPDLDMVAVLRSRLVHREMDDVSTASSDVVRDIADLRSAYVDTRQLLELTVAMSHRGRDVDVANPSLLGALLTIEHSGTLTQVAHRILKPMIEHDRVRGTTLLETVEAYLVHQGNATRTSEELNIHVNTLYQRLEKASAFLPSDWREGDSRLQLHLAIRMWRICGRP